MSKKAIIAIVIVVVCILGGVGGFFVLKYLVLDGQKVDENRQEEIKQVDEIALSRPLIVQFIETIKKKTGEESVLYFLRIDDKKVFTVPLPSDFDKTVKPVINGEYIFYLTSKKQGDDSGMVKKTVYRENILSGDKEKLAVTSLASTPKSLWVSPDGTYLVLSRKPTDIPETSEKDENNKTSLRDYKNEQSLSVVDIKKGNEEEVVPFSDEIAMGSFAHFDPEGRYFYFFERADDVWEIRALNLETKDIDRPFGLVNFEALSFSPIEEKTGEAQLVLSPDAQTILHSKVKKSRDVATDEKVSKTEVSAIRTRNGAKDELFSKEGVLEDLEWASDNEHFVYVSSSDDGSFDETEMWIATLEEESGQKVHKNPDPDKKIGDVHFLPDSRRLIYSEHVANKNARILLLEGKMYSEDVVYSRDVLEGERAISLTVLAVSELDFDLSWKSPNLVTTLRDSSTEDPIFGQGTVNKDQIINYVKERSSSLIKRKPYIGEEWAVTRFEFPQGHDDYVYVVYDDNHEMGRELLSCSELEGAVNCSVVGSFKVQGDTWRLEMGEDPVQESAITYYRFDPESRSFVIAESSSQKVYIPYSVDDLREIQSRVDKGEEQFRRDPVEAVKQSIPLGFKMSSEQEFKVVSEDDTITQVKAYKGDNAFMFTLKRVVREDQTGIWTIISVEKD
ncbi:hypothetical protein KKH43_01660 [Patescibacteria group bacterium]|nr:hypothetical protein [Patescibacteria group bacterium]